MTTTGEYRALLVSPSLTLKGTDLKRALTAGTVYFLALFALGFGFGTIRVIYLAPRVGQLVATFAEVPVMLVAALFACRWSVRHWKVPSDASIRWAMVLWFVVLLFAFEALLGAALFGRSVPEQWAALATAAGLVGLSAQMIAALMPVFIGRREQG